MRLLLDTHIAIWAVAERSRLSAASLDLIEDPAHAVYVSFVSVLEIAIKQARGPDRSRPPFTAQESLRFFPQAGFAFLDITPDHAAVVETLPRLHADSFDRLLVAQALAEPMRLITADAMVARYSDTVIRVP